MNIYRRFRTGEGDRGEALEGGRKGKVRYGKPGIGEMREREREVGEEGRLALEGLGDEGRNGIQ